MKGKIGFVEHGRSRMESCDSGFTHIVVELDQVFNAELVHHDSSLHDSDQERSGIASDMLTGKHQIYAFAFTSSPIYCFDKVLHCHGTF